LRFYVKFVLFTVAIDKVKITPKEKVEIRETNVRLQTESTLSNDWQSLAAQLSTAGFNIC